jgi:Raf kinase inhibitor-like YbhB/YbcL family protein
MADAMKILRYFLVSVVLYCISSCSGISPVTNTEIPPTRIPTNPPEDTRVPPTNEPVPLPTPTKEVIMRLSSPAFPDGSSIPVKFTCKGDDLSPQLDWVDAPQGTVTFTLVMDDPDAPVGTWDHWVLFNIPSPITSLPEGSGNGTSLPTGAVHGRNGWGDQKYGGPCPPSGIHHYSFVLYAIDTALSLPAGANKGAILKALEGHILAQAQLMGTFSK